MEWDNDRIIYFINEYKKKEILWKKDNKDYHNIVKKEDAWREIAEIMETEVEILKNKMISLRGSRRRIKSRMAKSTETGKGRKEINVSSWFAWESMKFLDDPENVRDTIEIYSASENEENVDNPPSPSLDCMGDIDITDIKEENSPAGQSSSISDEPASETNICPNTKGQAGKKKFKSPKKLAPRKRGEDPRVEIAYQILKKRSANAANERKDECSLFASYIGEKMRKLDGTKRAILMHEIHGLILEAELGTTTSQTYPQSQVPVPFSNYHSVPSSSHLPPSTSSHYYVNSPLFNSAYFSPIPSPLSSSTSSPHTPHSHCSSPLPSPHSHSNKIYPHNSSPPDSPPNPSSEPTK